MTPPEDVSAGRTEGRKPLGRRVHRHHFEDDYLVLPNALVRNEQLSYTARGILAECLSRPDGWHGTTSETWERVKKRQARRHDGVPLARELRDDIRAAFAELAFWGYIFAELVRMERGRIAKIVHVTDTPEPKDALTRDDKTFPQVAPKSGNSGSSVPPGKTRFRRSHQRAPMRAPRSHQGEEDVSAGRTKERTVRSIYRSTEEVQETPTPPRRTDPRARAREGSPAGDGDRPHATPGGDRPHATRPPTGDTGTPAAGAVSLADIDPTSVFGAHPVRQRKLADLNGDRITPKADPSAIDPKVLAAGAQGAFDAIEPIRRNGTNIPRDWYIRAAAHALTGIDGKPRQGVKDPRAYVRAAIQKHPESYPLHGGQR